MDRHRRPVAASYGVHCSPGALQRRDYLEAIRAAGFDTVKILSDQRRKKTDIGGDPITADMAAELENAASSITVMAVKRAACCCCGGGKCS